MLEPHEHNRVVEIKSGGAMLYFIFFARDKNRPMSDLIPAIENKTSIGLDYRQNS